MGPSEKFSIACEPALQLGGVIDGGPKPPAILDKPESDDGPRCGGLWVHGEELQNLVGCVVQLANVLKRKRHVPM